MLLIDISKKIDGGMVDFLECESYGILRIVGWCSWPRIPEFKVRCDGVGLYPIRCYRRSRPDVSKALDLENDLVGFSAEFGVRGAFRSCEVLAGSEFIKVPDGVGSTLSVKPPPYHELLGTTRVYHRDDVYGFGEPSQAVHPDILALGLTLTGPILDFGCGAGVLVGELLKRGIETIGIELDRPEIRREIRTEIANRVVLYGGQMPLPFCDGQFESTIATEVIEHIPDFRTAISEIARVCRSAFAITVPDMSCIPIGYRHGVLPWHLLESTHVNFFNHESLEMLLREHFRDIEFFQLAAGRVNGEFMPGSLGAIARK